jgi:F1F0 ATPase subunit 2
MTILVCFVVGVVLGALFYGGLRWTVDRLVQVEGPLRLAAASFLVRLLVVGLGFFLLVRESPACLGAGFLGFLAVRILLTWALGRDPDRHRERDLSRGRSRGLPAGDAGGREREAHGA